jgi:malate dehydrogenase (oxaloacetate-decarboxylating)(NADP+)
MIDKQQSLKFTEQEALDFHAQGKPGKISITSCKPLSTRRDLSLAYTPGVAIPCLAIKDNPATAYDYTTKGNLVAVISNGTAVLGLGKIGALASKPVMEGKAVLFKRFADIDAIDLEVDTADADTFINTVRYLEPSWGGINLEDIASPECFLIEEKLKEIMHIPVFHDDQHGTAIIVLAALINAAHLTGRDFKKMQIVVNGVGAAGIACMKLFKHYGLPKDNIIAVDTTGVIYEGRTEKMNPWKKMHAVRTDARTLADAIVGKDVFIGLSTKDALPGELLQLMAPNPIIFALANPNPEILPEIAKQVRPDVIIATGRSDYPNQVNNLIAFPYIFRGALDVRASSINDSMKLAAVEAIAYLARETVPESVSAVYGNQKIQYGREYILPSIFDPRLIYTVSAAVAEAAMKSGVAQNPIKDMDAYKNRLKKRLQSNNTL